MAKPLVFEFEGQNLSFEMTKVDRAKLYGYKEVEVLNEDGELCELATLADDGHTIVPKGGTGLGFLSADGSWSEKSELRPVDLNGQPIVPVGSSFGTIIPLSQPTTLNDYLDHTIRSVYVMQTEDGVGLVERIRNGAIYKFPYSFRGGIEYDSAFLLANEAGQVFMAVGNPAGLDFVGLPQVSSLGSDDDGGIDEEGDEMDFNMI
jgi:hypothetical protein